MPRTNGRRAAGVWPDSGSAPRQPVAGSGGEKSGEQSRRQDGQIHLLLVQPVDHIPIRADRQPKPQGRVLARQLREQLLEIPQLVVKVLVATTPTRMSMLAVAGLTGADQDQHVASSGKLEHREHPLPVYCSAICGVTPSRPARLMSSRSTQLSSARSASTCRASAGWSVMIPSTPRPIIVDMLIGSLTVQTSTFLFRLCADRMNAREANVALTARKSACARVKSPTATAVSSPSVPVGTQLLHPVNALLLQAHGHDVGLHVVRFHDLRDASFEILVVPIVLQFDDDAGFALAVGEHVGQRRHSLGAIVRVEPTADVDLLEIGLCGVPDVQIAARQLHEVAVVEDHDFTVGRLLHVDFHPVRLLLRWLCALRPSCSPAQS